MTTVTLTLADTLDILLTSAKEVLPSLSRLDETQINKKLGKAKLEDSACQVFDFIDTGVREHLSRNEYLALTSQSLRCWKAYLEGMGIPFSSMCLITHIHLLPHAVNKAFPGYADAGFLKSMISPETSIEQYKRIQLVA